jgi:dTDP-4-amino-4,6-dideoxygalactose transaminase
MIAVHGQKQKYQHEVVGCNSRLDTLQAAVLNVKLKYLDDYIVSRQEAAKYYFQNIKETEWIKLPTISPFTVHTFNQFTLKVEDNKRNTLQLYLKEKGIPSVIYYPLPLHKQPAFKKYVPNNFTLKNTEKLCNSVLSIPIHTELNQEIQDKIIETINNFN